MCGRFVQYSDPAVYASHFAAELAGEGPGPRDNLAPTQPVLAMRQAQDGRRAFLPLRVRFSSSGAGETSLMGRSDAGFGMSARPQSGAPFTMLSDTDSV
jgi:putative SOS response-associated peptidase YedK